MARKSKTNVSGYLGNVPEDKCFWCSDGKVLHNLNELASYLGSVSNESFKHHVSGKKNDFASWIYDVIGDVKLAESLRNITNRKEAAKKVKAHIAYIKRYSKKA